MEQSTILMNAKIYEENGMIPNGFIQIGDMKIQKIGTMSDYHQHDDDKVMDLQGKTVIPGFIDVHVHGAAGADAMDGELSSLQTMTEVLPWEGTTGFLATTMTQSDEKISKALTTAAQFIRHGQSPGQAEVLGIHLEGPFLNPKMAGAQPLEYIIPPNQELFLKWQDLAQGMIKQVTIAPEMEGGLDFASFLKELGMVVSIGHSAATFMEVKQAVKAGATQVTHLFNQMKGLHHREPGVVGAALLLDELYAELIVDGIHVCPEMIQFAYRNKKEKLILITDSMRAKCLHNGEYDLGGQKVFVQGRTAVLENGALAGSVLKLSDAVKNILNFCEGSSLVNIVRMAAVNPAKQLNLYGRKGSIRTGKDADLVILDKNNDVIMTFCRGKLAYHKEGAF